MTSAVKSVGSAVMVLLLLAGGTAIAYARWTRTIADADAALAQGDLERALGGYAAAEVKFDQLAAAKQLFPAEYNRVVGNQLWVLYRLQRFDDIIEKAERAPEAAAPHFWAACAFFEKARAEEKPDPRLGWLTRAEEEFRRAVETAPTDFDTKYNFELTTRLAAELRKQPKTPPNQLMQLLRPQPKAGSKPVKRVG